LASASNVVIVDHFHNAINVSGLLSVNVANLAANAMQQPEVKARKPYLYSPRIVKAGIGVEVDMKALSERRQAVNTLRSIEESRRSSYHQVQSRKTPCVDLVDELTKRIEPSFTGICSHALQSLDFVYDQDFSRMRSCSVRLAPSRTSDSCSPLPVLSFSRSSSGEGAGGTPAKT
jgi:hypothetical protein